MEVEKFNFEEIIAIVINFLTIKWFISFLFFEDSWIEYLKPIDRLIWFITKITGKNLETNKISFFIANAILNATLIIFILTFIKKKIKEKNQKRWNLLSQSQLFNDFSDYEEAPFFQLTENLPVYAEKTKEEIEEEKKQKNNDLKNLLFFLSNWFFITFIDYIIFPIIKSTWKIKKIFFANKKSPSFDKLEKILLTILEKKYLGFILKITTISIYFLLTNIFGIFDMIKKKINKRKNFHSQLNQKRKEPLKEFLNILTFHDLYISWKIFVNSKTYISGLLFRIINALIILLINLSINKTRKDF